MKNGLIKIQEQALRLVPFSSFSIIGDPGCDGLGAATMSIFARALHARPVDFSIIVGDLVPLGSKPLYENVSEFIEMLAPNPVFAICGNHDTEYFDSYFGRRNYVLFNDDILFIILDNSKREFSFEALELCRHALATYPNENVVILFHIPPPNSFTRNSLSREQWEPFREIYTPHRQRIRYLICGHVHSYFEDAIDDIPIIVSGGGGARIEAVDKQVDEKKARYHIVRFEFDHSKRLSHATIGLEDQAYQTELADATLAQYLQQAYQNEMAAHFKYRLFAEQAKDKGLAGLAKLFSALSESEFYHAKNHYYVLGQKGSVGSNLEDSLRNETYEVETLYPQTMQYAREKRHGLAKYAFLDALEAEKVHKKLLEDARANYLQQKDIPPAEYYTCSSCGYTIKADQKPSYCPICGAPQDKILLVK
ncbi:MAG: metallophosphoesterase [Candidatus Omnitrophica bacterium]|nr:metallophosphoesterase [Candidatus Omnitrophota bacterium]MDD5670951.1 metallophosphoesterase [Candidatus Omnitrophota bacterium]